MHLNHINLSKLPENVTTPCYDRQTLTPKMAHIGFGAFHRAHQALYTEKLTRQGENDWGYIEINLIGNEQHIQQLKQQDLLYSVTEVDDQTTSTHIVGTLCQALHPDIDGMATICDQLASSEVTIISLTITEKGYCHHPATGELNQDHPAILHDLDHPHQPISAIGVLARILALRYQQHQQGVTLMSCDNMPHNGHVLRNVILSFVEPTYPHLADWIRHHVTFPSTMVDRIVPAVTPESLTAITTYLGGINDPCGVVCEPFIQWVIEDQFPYGRPRWEHVGAQLVNDVRPYEEMKLRMLNGSHSFLAYLGYLAGYKTIDACMQDKNFANVTKHLMLHEQAVTLSINDINLQSYADKLLARYRNPMLKHKTQQIAMDGSQKLPQRMLESIACLIKQKRTFDCLALGVAGWMRYIDGHDEQGQSIDISDPLSEQLQHIVAITPQGKSRVEALIQLEHIFPKELAEQPCFINAITNAYQTLLEIGSKNAVSQLANKLQHSAC